MRLLARLAVGYEDPGRQVFLTTRDLSESGAYLLSPDPPEPGVVARLLLELPSQAEILRLPGLVVRCDRGAGFALHFEVGDFAEHTRGALKAYIGEGD